jgi:hypothetical protein
VNSWGARIGKKKCRERGKVSFCSRRSFYLAELGKPSPLTELRNPVDHLPEHEKQEPLLRIVMHFVLAVFVAMAANKFFVVDLDFELSHGFYARIFEFRGDAPDQYRILPLLPLKLLCQFVPFNHAVLMYNMVFGWLALELLWRMSKAQPFVWRRGLSFGFAILYIFLQYTGWRPDTMGLMCLCLASTIVLRDVRDRSLRFLLYALCIFMLCFSRAEIALIYALFATFYSRRSYAVLIPIPVIMQILMREVIFPDAVYYSKTFMLMDNLRLHYIVNQPATYLIIAVLIGFWRPITTFLRLSFRKNFYFYLLAAGYVILVLLIGRLNEYRLYLPFVPLFLMIAHGSKPAQRN